MHKFQEFCPIIGLFCFHFPASLFGLMALPSIEESNYLVWVRMLLKSPLAYAGDKKEGRMGVWRCTLWKQFAPRRSLRYDLHLDCGSGKAAWRSEKVEEKKRMLSPTIFRYRSAFQLIGRKKRPLFLTSITSDQSSSLTWRRRKYSSLQQRRVPIRT